VPALGLFCLFLTWTICGCGTGRLNHEPSPNFVVFDATLYQGKPDLTSTGIKSLTALYSSYLWPPLNDRSSPPDPNTVNSILQQAETSSGTVFLDIENWPLNQSPSMRTESIQKYLITLQSFEQFAPSLKFGYYSVAPEGDYYDAISGPNSPQYKAWQSRNDSVAPIATQAAALFPSIYTFYPNQNAWKTYAIAQIAEARRIAPGKPVYVFLWPQYDLQGAVGDYLPIDYWAMELETARQYADGIVIWGGYGETWNNDAPWWLETQDFMRENGT
ncbi:MAG: hypothetical protein WB608_07200, partial [Terracidiphilus sp.]